MLMDDVGRFDWEDSLHYHLLIKILICSSYMSFPQGSNKLLLTHFLTCRLLRCRHEGTVHRGGPARPTPTLPPDLQFRGQAAARRRLYHDQRKGLLPCHAGHSADCATVDGGPRTRARTDHQASTTQRSRARAGDTP